jgi:lipopolysaccharide/colanic/teichoic acid biosynthesis glycosyltransferase
MALLVGDVLIYLTAGAALLLAWGGAHVGRAPALVSANGISAAAGSWNRLLALIFLLILGVCLQVWAFSRVPRMSGYWWLYISAAVACCLAVGGAVFAWSGGPPPARVSVAIWGALPLLLLERVSARFAYEFVRSREPVRSDGLGARRFSGRVAQRALKVCFDMLVGLILLLFLSPVLIALMLYVRSDGGPALFGQFRVGRNGRLFRCFKIRTMVVDAEDRLREMLDSDPNAAREWTQTHKLTRDPRITRIGTLLRQTSLDELPQLLNVVRGEMSLVGPRPIVMAEAARYADAMDFYCAVRPGITGLWQVSGRSRLSYSERVRLDVQYVTDWSLYQDFLILLRTVPAVLLRRGAV